MRAARSVPAALLAIAVVGAALVGCRLAGSAPATASLPPPASDSAREVAGAPSSSPPGQEAPEECSFRPGTALEFAGRSTYAELGVGDGGGSDPMSDEPADIYITRDTFNQGQNHGRLVCAIFVDPGWVEVTIHPEDSAANFTPAPRPGQPPNGLSETEAAEAARAALPEPDEWVIRVGKARPMEAHYPQWLAYDWVRRLPADHWAWTVEAVREDRGVFVVIDYVEGTLLGTIEYILDECDPRSSEYVRDECFDGDL